MNQLLSALKRKNKKLGLSYEKWAFNLNLHPLTKSQRASILKNAEDSLANKVQFESELVCQHSPDPTVRQGYQLKQTVCQSFLNQFQGSTQRILIHVPSAQSSPAGYSLFSNIAECLNFMGVPTAILGWGEDSNLILQEFKPTIFLTSEHDSYLNQIDWVGIAKYRESHTLKVGITAPLLENDLAPNHDKIIWAKQHSIDFFYSFRDAQYVQSQAVYKELINEGFPILCMPWGANILRYYPVGGMERDLNYVLIASRKREHITYMRMIAKQYPGFIDGPGWNHIKDFSFSRDRDRYIYSRAKVGLNVHLPEQINNVYELNERTYQLAACGAPQLIDHPKLLDKTFSKNAIFIAESAKEYGQLFTELMHNPALGQEAALIAQREVFANHTTFHRAQDFLNQLKLLK